MKHITVLRDLRDTTIEVRRAEKQCIVLPLTTGNPERSRITVKLTGEGASVDIIGLIVGTGTEQFPFETQVEHIAQNTRAHTYIHGVLNDASMIDFKGMIVIGKTAILTDAYLAHHTLLLSKNARCKTIPALEIEADDVKAGHAASIGKIDPESLLYIVSRGIDAKSAERMMVEGFLEQGLARIPDESLRSELRNNLFAHLHTT